MTLGEYVAAFWRREGAREDRHRAPTGELLVASQPTPGRTLACDGCFYQGKRRFKCFPPEENCTRALCTGDERRDRTTIIWTVCPEPEVEPNPL